MKTLSMAHGRAVKRMQPLVLTSFFLAMLGCSGGGSDSAPSPAPAPPPPAPSPPSPPPPPPSPPAQPITATARTWTWVPFADTRCQDNSTAGISVNLNPASNRLLIVLQGGDDCVDSTQCAFSSHPVDIDHARNPAEFGILARDQAANPFAEWNLVFVPYCTGDVHAGDLPDATVPFASGVQQFVGWRNMGSYLKRVAATLPSPAQVVLAGCSSGGVGALANFPQVQRTFSGTRVTLLADSGPPIPAGDPGGVHAALVNHWRADLTLGRECGAACSNPNTLFVDYFGWMVNHYPNNTFALSDYTDDIAWPPEYGLSSDQWTAHLLAVRGIMQRAPSATGSYIVAGSNHCVVDAGNMYSTRTANVRYTDWLAGVIASPPAPVHIGP